MSWAKLDDGILDNPKVAGVGLLGFAWYAAGLVYCNRNLTDGFIPYGTARQLAPLMHTDSDGAVWEVAATCGMQGVDTRDLTEHLIAWLVKAGLWREVPGGYRVHDFETHNPSKAEVLARREYIRGVRRAAGTSGGQQSAKQRASKRLATEQANPRQPVEQKATPVPVPVPVPEEKAPERERRRGRRLPDAFVLTPERRAVALRKGLPASRHESEFEKFRDWFMSAPGSKGLKLDWDATWRTWCANAVERFAPRGPTKHVRETAEEAAKRKNTPALERLKQAPDPGDGSGLGTLRDAISRLPVRAGATS